MYDVENTITFLLAKAFQRGWAMLREEIAEYDLTPPQFCLLAFLWQQDGLTQVELSEKAQIDRSTVGEMLDRLEKTSLVERRPHPHDRRAYKIHLTGQGRGLEAPLTECAKRVREKLTSGLNEHDISELIRMLKILRAERGNGGNS